MIEFFLPMKKIPTTTHQQKKVNVQFGKPIFYEPADLKNARAKFESLLAQHVPPDEFKGAIQQTINYIDFFSRVIPEWMARSNQKSQEVGFGSDAYWLWTVSSIGEICRQYNDDELVTEQFGLLFNWLEKQAGG